MNEHRRHPVEEYSESYFLLPDIDVVEYSGEQVAVSDDTMRALHPYVSAPLVKLSTGHYWLRPEWGIPGDTIAVPSDRDEDTDHALLAKDRTTKELLHQGIVDAP